MLPPMLLQGLQQVITNSLAACQQHPPELCLPDPTGKGAEFSYTQVHHKPGTKVGDVQTQVVLVNDTVSWTEAAALCQARGGELLPALDRLDWNLQLYCSTTRSIN